MCNSHSSYWFSFQPGSITLLTFFLEALLATIKYKYISWLIYLALSEGDTYRRFKTVAEMGNNHIIGNMSFLKILFKPLFYTSCRNVLLPCRSMFVFAPLDSRAKKHIVTAYWRLCKDYWSALIGAVLPSTQDEWVHLDINRIINN